VSFRRYGQYKESGVSSLGKIPAHWDVKRIHHLTSRISSGKTPLGGSETYVDEGIIFLRSQNVYDEGLELEDVVFISEITDAQMAVSRVQPRDILLNITGASIGRSCAVPEGFPPANVNQHVCAIRMSNQDQVPFISWCFRSAAMKAQMDYVQNGAAREGLNFEQIATLSVAVPPSDEQPTISAFLERAVSATNKLVAEQQRLIDLLKEKRQAVITHAVTRGLNPNAPMKDSGIEWVGDIPRHWECACLSRVAQRVVVGIAEAATHAYADEGIAILRSTNIRPGAIGGDILFIDPSFAKDRDTKQLHAGDLVTVRTGNAGVTAVVPRELDGCQCFTMLITTLNDQSRAEYYCYWMNSVAAQRYFTLEGWGTAQVNISVPILKALPVPIPPHSEQREIVAYLDREVGKIDSLCDEVETAISLLQERRSALISAVVTGKVDVRGVVGTEIQEAAA
jgi:type I restriction enzyme, S subunit